VCCRAPRIGTAPKLSAKGSVIVLNSAVSGTSGVRPPCDQMALPIRAVSPSATMLMAVPETIWLAR
jgi:hypothetical protein